jgi:hypothetical protein
MLGGEERTMGDRSARYEADTPAEAFGDLLEKESPDRDLQEKTCDGVLLDLQLLLSNIGYQVEKLPPTRGLSGGLALKSLSVNRMHTIKVIHDGAVFAVLTRQDRMEMIPIRYKRGLGAYVGNEKVRIEGRVYWESAFLVVARTIEKVLATKE